MTREKAHTASQYLAGIVKTCGIALLLAVAASGCRTYGRYGTEGKTVATIERINEQFARSLARAESDLATVQAGAESDPELQGLADAFASVVSEHRQLLASHNEDLERLIAGATGYRAASRLLGSIVTDHHRIANRYRAVVAAAAELAGKPAVAVRARALYQQVPPNYVRLENRVVEPKLGDVVRSMP